MNENPFFDAPIPKKTSKFIVILQGVAIFTIILLVIWIIFLEQNQVRGPSMQPNFVTGEFLLTNRIPKFIDNSNVASIVNAEYQRGDVVVFQKPGLDDFVKRVIGLPGESISIDYGYIYINGKKLDEDYISDDLYTSGGDLIREGGMALEIPQGYYALIGDNRPQSNDSRFGEVGFIKRSWIKGKVLLRIWPLEKFSLIPQGKYRLE